MVADYNRLVRRLKLLPGVLMCAWTTALAGSSFPFDSQDPHVAGGAELLEAVCPGRVSVGKEIRCRIVCPEFTSFPGDQHTWSLKQVTRGHFLSPTSEDVALSMSGCEPHSENNGGTILLTRRAQRWVMLWYKAGVETEECHKMALKNGREILACIGGYGAQGRVWTDFYLEDLRAPAAVLMADAGRSHFFEILDDTAPAVIRRTGLAR